MIRCRSKNIPFLLKLNNAQADFEVYVDEVLNIDETITHKMLKPIMNSYSDRFEHTIFAKEYE